VSKKALPSLRWTANAKSSHPIWTNPHALQPPALEIAKIAAHIEPGKLPTQLALSWQGRGSFVLHESGCLRKLKLLDVALQGQGAAAVGKDDVCDPQAVLVSLADCKGCRAQALCPCVVTR